MAYDSADILNKVLTEAEKKERSHFLNNVLDTLKKAKNVKDFGEYDLFDSYIEKVDIYYLAMVIEKLRNNVKELQKQIYSPKAEPIPENFLFSPEQLAAAKALILGDLASLRGENLEKDLTEPHTDDSPESTLETPKPKVKPKRGLGLLKSLPENMDVIDNILPIKEIPCPNGHGFMEFSHYDESKKLAMIPAKFFIQNTKTPVYKCLNQDCEKMYQEESKKTILGNSSVDSSILAKIIINKFALSIPFYRQEKFYFGSDIKISRQWMAQKIISTDEYIAPFVSLLKEEIIKYGSFHMDETTFKILNSHDEKLGANKKSYCWMMRSGWGAPPAVVYSADLTRKEDVPVQMVKPSLEKLKSFENKKIFLHIDGYEGYNKLFRDQPILERCACFAHVRRYFYKALMDLPEKERSNENKPEVIVMKYITEIYTNEKLINKNNGITAEERLVLRIRGSQEIWNSLICFLADIKDKKSVRKDSLFWKALTYFIGNPDSKKEDHGELPFFNGYFTCGYVSLDNNIGENALRPFIVGRKNWLFSDTLKGAEASCDWYSIVQTAIMNGIVRDELEIYITDIIETMAEKKPNMERLLPWNWKKWRLENKKI